MIEDQIQQIVVTKTITDRNGQEKQVQVKQFVREVKVRKQVLERQQWKKWGEVAEVPRGTFKEGDMLVEAELRIQASNNQEELNFVVPPPKTQFVVNNEKQVPEQKKTIEQNNNSRQIGQPIQFETYEQLNTSTWLLIISNLVYFEDAQNYGDIIKTKDRFRDWLEVQLGIEEGKNTYFVNFLQNKRKPRVFNSDGTYSHHPLIQKVMLKFPDKQKAEFVYKQLLDKAYDNCILCLEIQEQRPR
ncbi:hypothetical protein pb186bvf_007730 [Paramecium bursaria]